MLKALLVHGSSWGETFNLLDAVFPPHGRTKFMRRREAISRFLGYGRVDVGRIFSADRHRVTLLADDVIGHDGLHHYRVPVPRAMIGNRDVRRVIMTLAWSTPVDPGSTRYRGFALEMVNREGKRNFWHGVGSGDRPQPDARAGRRGTVQHLVLEGKRMLGPAHGGEFFVGVQARAAVNAFAGEEVPYGLAITLEMAQPLRQDLFADVVARVRPKVAVRATAPTRIRTRS